jgi:hypothetical protein
MIDLILDFTILAITRRELYERVRQHYAVRGQTTTDAMIAVAIDRLRAEGRIEFRDGFYRRV